MVKLRMWRTGAKGHPTYRIVAIDARKKLLGEYIERVGLYNPSTKEVSFNEEAVMKWLRYGAHPSESVRTLLTIKGIYQKFLESKRIKST